MGLRVVRVIRYMGEFIGELGTNTTYLEYKVWVWEVAV